MFVAYWEGRRKAADFFRVGLLILTQGYIFFEHYTLDSLGNKATPFHAPLVLKNSATFNMKSCIH